VTLVELALVLASALIHAWWSVAIKGSRDPLVFNLLQEIAPAAILIALLPWIEWGELPSSLWRLLAATGVAHGVYFYWMSRAYEHGELTLVYPIARSTPAVIPLIAVPWLGESISRVGGLGIATVVAGMWLVQVGPGLRLASLATPAVGFAFLTLAATVGYSLFDKAAMAELAAGPWSSPLPRALIFCLLLSVASTVVFAPLVLMRRGSRALRAGARGQLGAATVASLVSVAGYGLALRALETAPISYVVAARQSSVLFALILSVLWLGERPGRPRVLGALLTFAGVAMIALSGPG
jgi:drug/metabolite transporter (DMT)-like permease